MNKQLVSNCKSILNAYQSGKLGQTVMPEDTNPGFKEEERELQLGYFTLPMALNYQRNSYKLWTAALQTFQDEKTRFVFNVTQTISESEVQKALLKYKLALQPNKHIATWMTISKTIQENWGSFSKFIDSTQGDFLNLRQIVTKDYKKGFPYLSGPKIFNYWSFIISTYGGANLKNRDKIEIAPDTHVTQCSIRLGLITQEESEKLSKETISERWRIALEGSGIDPIDMHPPLWFWSRNGFIYNG